MALTALGALIMMVLAYLAQSPRLLKRLRLVGYRLDLRARAFTGYALASLLLALGFFLAGVPLGPQTQVAETVPDATAVAEQPTSDVAQFSPQPQDEASPTTAVVTSSPEENDTAASGAFGQPSATAQAESADTAVPDLTSTAPDITTLTEATTPDATPTPGDASAPAEATPSPAPSATPTPTPSPTTTASPTPTASPTAIVGETAVLNTGTGTLWLKRTPGGADFVLARGGDLVLLLSGHANHGGRLWREISTLDGTRAWVEESFLSQLNAPTADEAEEALP